MTPIDAQRWPTRGRRSSGVTLRLLLALLLGITASLGAAAPVGAAARVPKVALIVGPVGGTITARYKELANEAATVARKAGAEVAKVYSPNATWPAVREAIEGASIVVYLGHGNGWPSRYRDALYPPSQNGFGLNPVAGVDDSTHQYFGEAAVEKLELAPNAVVLLHHLCYASGNTEPGLPEGSRAQAIERVDNYAAGFIRAGARAVVAEGHMGPAWYVDRLLRSDASIEAIWGRSPSAHGNLIKLGSDRSPGFTARLDPDRPNGGFYRSLVSRGVTAVDLRAGAPRAPSATTPAIRGEPSLVQAGIRFGQPSLRNAPVAGARTSLLLPLTAGGGAPVPKGVQVGVRWEPVLLEPVLPAAPPDASVPATGLPLLEAPPVDLVVPEQPGTVVEPSIARRSDDRIRASVHVPAAPGLYRVVMTIHQPSGVAYDAATQDLLTPFIVRVGAPVSVAYGVLPSVSMTAGSPAVIPVRVVNTGQAAWPRLIDGGLFNRLPASLVATWLSPDGQPVPDRVATVLNAEETVPGAATSLVVPLVAPAAPGDYLLLLDVVSPEYGALSALGSAPGIVRVTVGPSGRVPVEGAEVTS